MDRRCYMCRAGVILSGCGGKDGTDIAEAVMLFLALDRAGVETICMSIDKDQFSCKPSGQYTDERAEEEHAHRVGAAGSEVLST